MKVKRKYVVTRRNLEIPIPDVVTTIEVNQGNRSDLVIALNKIQETELTEHITNLCAFLKANPTLEISDETISLGEYNTKSGGKIYTITYTYIVTSTETIPWGNAGNYSTEVGNLTIQSFDLPLV